HALANAVVVVADMAVVARAIQQDAHREVQPLPLPVALVQVVAGAVDQPPDAPVVRAASAYAIGVGVGVVSLEIDENARTEVNARALAVLPQRVRVVTAAIHQHAQAVPV